METYSLLKNHEEVVTYRVPDPTGETEAFVEIGLYPWKLEGVSMDEAMQAGAENREPEPGEWEGIGLRLLFKGPMRYYPEPEAPRERIKEQFELKSYGSRRNGRTFRIEDTTTGEVRQTALQAAHYAFAYWWALSRHDDFTPYVQRNERSHERKDRLDIIDEVQADGMIVYSDGSTDEYPATVDDLELLDKEEWDAPSEECLEEMKEFIESLTDEYPDYAVWDAFSAVDVKEFIRFPEPTDEYERSQKFKKQLATVVNDAEGVGQAMKRFIRNEFDSMQDLCDDIRDGGERLRQHSHIGDKVEDSLINAMIENQIWPESSDD